MLVSLPLSRQAADTYIALTHRCDYDDLTHRTYEYWTVLHNIRSHPECATAASVEECDGYEQAPPYTTFLKTLEAEFRCSVSAGSRRRRRPRTGRSSSPSAR